MFKAALVFPLIVMETNPFVYQYTSHFNNETGICLVTVYHNILFIIMCSKAKKLTGGICF